MFYRRAVAAVLAPAIALALTACGRDSDDTSDGTGVSQASPTASPSVGDGSTATAAHTATNEPTATAEPLPTLATLEPQLANASSYVGGSSLVLPPGEPGVISVIAVGQAGDSVPVVVRNNTDKPIIRIKLQGMARDGNGNLIASGEDQGLDPTVVRPGEIAFGYVYFGYDSNLPTNATLQITASGTTANSDDYFLSLNITELNHLPDRIVGIATNPHDRVVSGPISVGALCFDVAGNPTDGTGTFADGDAVEPGGQVSFQTSTRNIDCPQFIVALSGYAD